MQPVYMVATELALAAVSCYLNYKPDYKTPELSSTLQDTGAFAPSDGRTFRPSKQTAARLTSSRHYFSQRNRLLFQCSERARLNGSNARL